MARNNAILKAAESVRDAVFVAECTRDTDGDGDCGRICRCRELRGGPRELVKRYGTKPCWCGRSDCPPENRALHKQIFDRPMGMTD